MLKLNLCCGMDYREDYINIDFSDVGSDGNPIKIDRKLNILESLPYETCSIDEIIWHESMEHFNRWNSLKILKEIFRVLKISGQLSLTVPNAERQMKILLSRMNDKVTIKDFTEAHERFSFWKWHDDLAGATHESDGFDGDSHKSFWSQNSLKMIIEFLGFKIKKFDVDSSLRVIAVK